MARCDVQALCPCSTGATFRSRPKLTGLHFGSSKKRSTRSLTFVSLHHLPPSSSPSFLSRKLTQNPRSARSTSPSHRSGRGFHHPILDKTPTGHWRLSDDRPSETPLQHELAPDQYPRSGPHSRERRSQHRPGAETASYRVYTKSQGAVRRDVAGEADSGANSCLV